MSVPIAQASDQLENRRPASFGARLKQEREQRGVTLEQISQSTKIGTRFLQALEEDHFQQLPGGIFNKGFVRAYARFVGIDEEQAVADYLAATSPSQPKPELAEEAVILEPPAEKERESAKFSWGVFATLLLIAAFGLSAWGFYTWVTSPRTKQPARTPQANFSATTAEQPQPTTDLQSSSGSLPPGGSATTAKKTRTAAPSPATAPETASAATAIPGDLVLKISARENAWLSTTVDGEVTTQQTLAASADKTIRARHEILIKAGNIGALDFEFKGKQLPVQGKEGEVKTLVFDANGWHVVPKPAPVAEPEPQP